MRFFLALEIPPEDKQSLKSIQNRLQNILPDIRLTDPDKLHLTLVFVGDQKPELKEALIEVMNHAVEGIGPFEVTPAYIDGFPTIHHPETIWVGVKGDVDKLHILRERIKDGLISLNLPVDERRFVPHIAIAKAQQPEVTLAQEERLEVLVGEVPPIVVTSIKLLQSIPDDGLHTHNTLAEIKLL